MARKTHTEAQARYDKVNRRVYGFRLHNVIDADIIAKLASVDSMQGYIKQLIREDLARTCSVPDTDSVPKNESEDKKMKSTFRIIHRFPGKHTWQELNELIKFDSGVQEPYCETEEDYNMAVREGFIRYDGKETTVWVDD